MIHTIPIDDKNEHVEESTCHCHPRIIEENGELICIHQAFDARELIEEGLQPFAPTKVKARDGRDLLEGDIVETVQGSRFICLTILGIKPFLSDRNKVVFELQEYMSPNLFYIGNVVNDLKLRHDFFHKKD